MRVALDALSERWIAVGQLIQTGERSSQNHEGVIERVFGRDGHFLLRRDRAAFQIRARGAIVGQDAENALAARRFLIQWIRGGRLRGRHDVCRRGVSAGRWRIGGLAEHQNGNQQGEKYVL